MVSEVDDKALIDKLGVFINSKEEIHKEDKCS